MNEPIAALLELAGEHQARAIVSALCPPRTLQVFDRQAAIIRAREMLKNGMHPHEMAYRLAGRYGTSIKTAQRRIKASLAMGQW